jgi:hypothetical protein
MSDYAASVARRLVEPPAILPRRASPFEPERGALVAEELDSVVDVARTDRRAARPTVQERRPADRTIESAYAESLVPAREAVHFARPTVPVAGDAARSPFAGPEGSAISLGGGAARPAAVLSVGEGVDEIDSRLPPGRAADDTAVITSIGSSVVAPRADTAESSGGPPVAVASSPDVEKRPRPDPVKATLAGARQFATERFGRDDAGPRESSTEAPAQGAFSITPSPGLDASSEPSLPVRTEPTLESILTAPALPAGPVARPGPAHSLDPAGLRPAPRAPEAEPAIEVHIGRIEVRAMTPPPPPAHPARPRIPAMTLDEYRRKRQERRP